MDSYKGGGEDVSSSVRGNACEECDSYEDKSSRILEHVLIVLMHIFVIQSLKFYGGFGQEWCLVMGSEKVENLEEDEEAG